MLVLQLLVGEPWRLVLAARRPSRAVVALALALVRRYRASAREELRLRERCAEQERSGGRGGFRRSGPVRKRGGASE